MFVWLGQASVHHLRLPLLHLWTSGHRRKFDTSGDFSLLWNGPGKNE